VSFAGPPPLPEGSFVSLYPFTSSKTTFISVDDTWLIVFILKACANDVLADHIPTTILDISEDVPVNVAVYMFGSDVGETFVNRISGQKVGSAILTNDKCQRIYVFYT
jgi:hypothetical protein